MKRVIAFGLGAAAMAVATVAATGANAADMPGSYRVRKQAQYYERPVPRVYYAPVRPAAVCRVAAVDRDTGWPQEQRRVLRCTDFY